MIYVVCAMHYECTGNNGDVGFHDDWYTVSNFGTMKEAKEAARIELAKSTCYECTINKESQNDTH